MYQLHIAKQGTIGHIPTTKKLACDKMEMYINHNLAYQWTEKNHSQSTEYLSYSSRSLKLVQLTAYISIYKVVWEIRTSILGNERPWTYFLYWNMQSSYEQSGHPF